MTKKLISESLLQAQNALDTFIQSDAAERIEKAANMIVDSFNSGGKVISCGNGGSLCDATHFAEEFTGRFRNNRKPYPAIAINDPAYITCVGNDYSFDEIFSRYVEATGNAGDVLLAISTSGNSSNIVKAVEAARQKGLKTLVLTSTGENKLATMGDVVIAAPKTPYSDRIQEIHIKIIHILIQAIEQKLGFE